MLTAEPPDAVVDRWSSGVRLAGGTEVVVTGSGPGAAQVLEELLRDLPASTTPSGAPWRLDLAVEPQEAGLLHVVSVEGAHLLSAGLAERALAGLLWAMNQAVLRGEQPGQLAFHAAVVARGGAAVALVGESQSGKSTTAAGLVASGWRYLTDEVAVVDLARGEVLPYPKPLSLADDVLERLEVPRPSWFADEPLATRRQVAASRVGEVATTPVALAGVLAVSRGSGRTAVVDRPPSAAALALAAVAASGSADAPSFLAGVARTAERVRFAELHLGDDAVAGAVTARVDEWVDGWVDESVEESVDGEGGAA